MGKKKQKKSAETDAGAAWPAQLIEKFEYSWKAYCDSLNPEQLALVSHPEFFCSLQHVWLSSVFVEHACVRHPELLPDLVGSGDLLCDTTFTEMQDRILAATKQVSSEKDLIKVLREMRRREMVRIAWRDIAGWASLEETLEDLTHLADICIQTALDFLEVWLVRDYGEPRANGKRQRLVVLGMGKLGAHELNFSSDIDLICVYPLDGECKGRLGLSNEEFFTRLTKKLVNVLAQPTVDGFVYRTDLRLRPFGDSGPVALSFEAMEDYYESQGREWERYAFIKARVVAGDAKAGQELLESLRPFVYRRYLDFNVIESIRDMKNMIALQVKRKGMENNVKLGAGGIREIEFIGQTFQLIRGGRQAALRIRSIQQVLRVLGELDYLPEKTVNSLINGYRVLRIVENRLQQLNDQQTHDLPVDEIEKERLAASLGVCSWKALIRDVDQVRKMVHEEFGRLFSVDKQVEAAKSPGEELWKAIDHPEIMCIKLDKLGYDRIQETCSLLTEYAQSYVMRHLGPQGRARLERLMPLLLVEIGQSSQPHLLLTRVLHVLEIIGGRATYLALMEENEGVRKQLLTLCMASPWITDLLASQPVLLDEFINPVALYKVPTKEEMRDNVQQRLSGIDPDDLESQMEVLRQFKQASVLRVAAVDVTDRLPLMRVSDYLTEIAEVVVEQVFALCWQRMTAKYGEPPGRRKNTIAGFGVIAYGKFGGIELGFGSDLDLVFIHDEIKDECATKGKKALDCVTFFIRLAQRMLHLLNTNMPAGVLYEVDMRLRPNGKSGMIVSSIDSLEDYQHHDAWTWEHQALVRTRYIAGDARLGQRFLAVRSEILSKNRDTRKLRDDVLEMRERMRKELGNKFQDLFDLKQDAGGIVDIEFMVQFGVLKWSGKYPDLLEYPDNIRLLEVLGQHGLLKKKEVDALSQIYLAYRERVHELALQELPSVVPADEFKDERKKVITIWRRLFKLEKEQPAS